MLDRRETLKTLALAPFLSIAGSVFSMNADCHKLKTSLNAFSFNEPLSKGEINLFQVLDFCAEQGFDAVDITGYYFPEYPKLPSDEYIYAIKRKASSLGLEISGSGVRNDFTIPEKSKRNDHIQLVKNWIDVSQKMGAPVIRIFAGDGVKKGFTWEQTAEWVISAIQECVDYGKSRGVIVAVQNHNDFIQTPEHIHYLMKRINDPWFGLIMDTGGFRNGETYEEIAQTIKYAVNWQIKEKIFVNGIEMNTDYKRLITLIKNSCYKGYIPIETLGQGAPGEKVIAMMTELRKEF